jgi:FkbH-like protein
VVNLPNRCAWRVGVAGSFSAAPLKPFLDFWFQQLCSDFELEFASYGQVLEPLRGVGWLHNRPEGGVLCADVVLLRPEDLLRDETNSLSLARARVLEIAQAVESSREALLVGIVAASPGSSKDSTTSAFDMWARKIIAGAVRRGPTTHWLELEGAATLYDITEVHDSFRDELAHIPFTDNYLAAVATTIARSLRALWEPSRKVIVLDCDNTLWGGACGEGPIEALEPNGPYARLRAFMLKQFHAGRLLCLASRNREADVMEAFTRCANPLSFEHIAAHRVSGGRKSDALLSLSKELRLSPDDFIFVDDDPVECAEVRAALPTVAVVELPADIARIPQMLDHVWEFDFLDDLTDEDRSRGAAYTLEARRRRERYEAPSLEEFVRGLRVRVDAQPLDCDNLARAVQVFARTNQFNLTGARCSERELLALAEQEDTDVLVVRVQDRLGDYGLVGALVLRFESHLASLDRFALSCRVLHRGVEAKVIREVAQRAHRNGCRELGIAFRPTERNRPARDFLDRLGGQAAGRTCRWEGDMASTARTYLLRLDGLERRLASLELAD